MMAEITRKDVFNMDIDEFKHIRFLLLNKPCKTRWTEVHTFITPANFKEIPNLFVHEYANGKNVLIEIDEATAKEHFLKNL